jgi:hypothetical protein
MSSNPPDNNILRMIRQQTINNQNTGNEGYQPVVYNNNANAEEQKSIWFSPLNICFLLMTILIIAIIVILIIVYK